LVAQLAKPGEIALGQRKAAGGAGDRLDNDGRHGGRVFELELPFQSAEAIQLALGEGLAEVAAVAVRIEEANGAGRPGLDRGAPWIAADAEAAERGAVVAAILGKDLRPAGDHAGEDEGLVVRLAAAVDEEALSQIAGGELGKLAGQEDAILGQHLRRDTRGLGRLPLNRLDDLAIAVAEVAVEQLR